MDMGVLAKDTHETTVRLAPPLVRDAGGPRLGDGADPGGAARARGLNAPGHEPDPLPAGTAVTLRERWRGRTLAARPVRIVEDLPHHHRAFWFAPGTRWKNDPRDHGEVRFYDGAWELEDLILEGGVLSFAFPETSYAVLMRIDATGTFTHYYVNIQSPLRRSPVGFDYVDLFLDVRIAADRSSYGWKDEDELQEAVDRGMVSEREAHDIRWAGERAIEHVVLREPPFDRDWAAWSPDPSWEPPSLPDRWDEETGAEARMPLPHFPGPPA